MASVLTGMVREVLPSVRQSTGTFCLDPHINLKAGDPLARLG